ncbi:MAG TPA: ABC transporter ATP-binding protein, partial [Burkholderiaceae bacterium]
RYGARLAWALERQDLRAAAATRAAELPLGFQRRLAVACALLHEPDVLFLDEPTSGIDPLARQHLWELVYELAERGIGVLVTTHYMDEALFCDRLALMDAGRVIAEGTPEDLLARPLEAPAIEVQDEVGSGGVGSGGAGSEMARWLAQRPEVREVLPRAGRLRVRLAPGQDFEAAIERLRDGAAARGTPLRIDPRPEPELEDAFVALLEAQAARAGAAQAQ